MRAAIYGGHAHEESVVGGLYAFGRDGRWAGEIFGHFYYCFLAFPLSTDKFHSYSGLVCTYIFIRHSSFIFNVNRIRNKALTSDGRF